MHHKWFMYNTISSVDIHLFSILTSIGVHGTLCWGGVDFQNVGLLFGSLMWVNKLCDFSL